MVVGTIITTTLDVTLNLTLWTAKKLYNGVYILIYGDESEDRKLKKELTQVKKELENIRTLIENQNHLEQPTSNTIISKVDDSNEKITDI